MKVSIINGSVVDLRISTRTGNVTVGYVLSLGNSVYDLSDGLVIRDAKTGAVLFSATFTSDVSVYVPKTGAIQAFASYTSSSSPSLGAGVISVVESADITAAVLISWFFLWAIMKGISRK